MAGKGKLFTFHGMFRSKAKAVARESDRPGSFVKEVMFKKKRGKGKGKAQHAWVVMSPR